MSDAVDYSALANKLAPLLRKCIAPDAQPWEEALFWFSMPTPTQESTQRTYRLGRELNFFSGWFDRADNEALQEGMRGAVAEIASTQGRAPKVVVLSVSSNGASRFACNFENANALNITFNHVGSPGAYFTLDQIDPPEHVLKALAVAREWEKILEGKPVLELVFLDSDFGSPCPERSFDIEQAIDGEFSAAKLGRVVASEYRDGDAGALYAVIRVAVVDLTDGLSRLTKVLNAIRAPKGTTLRQISPAAADHTPELKDKKTLMLEMANDLMNQLVSHSVRCSPASWKQGKLTIACDGERVDYKLKNEKSKEKAAISDELKQLCEDFCVLMWKNGQQWREAVLSFARNDGQVSFKTSFNYEAPVGEEPVAQAETKPWWRFW